MNYLRATTPLPERPFSPWLFTVAMAREFDEAGQGLPDFGKDVRFFNAHRDGGLPPIPTSGRRCTSRS